MSDVIDWEEHFLQSSFLFDTSDVNDLLAVIQKDVSKKLTLSDIEKRDFQNFLNRSFFWQLKTLGADSRSGDVSKLLKNTDNEVKREFRQLSLSLNKFMNVYCSLNEVTLSRLEASIQWRIAEERFDDDFCLEDFFDDIHEVQSAIDEMLKSYNSKVKKYSGKGRPNLKLFKSLIWEAAVHYRVITGKNPTFLRHKGDNGSYLRLTVWHEFVCCIVEKVQPFMCERITEKQIVTACEYAVKKMNQTFTDKIVS